MADRYWVGGGSSANWNATGNTNWSATSGGPNNASVPGAADNVFFDGVGTGASNSTISASIAVLSFTVTSGYANTLTHNSAVNLTVAGNITLGANMIYVAVTGTATVIVSATSTITSNGITFPGRMTFSGANTKTLVGNAILTGVLTVSGVTVINKTTSETFTIGGLTMTSACSGTITLIHKSGAWGGTAVLSVAELQFDGTITSAGSLNVSNIKLKYISGTYSPSLAANPLSMTGTMILDTGPIVFNTVTWSNMISMTINSDFKAVLLQINNLSFSLLGTAGFTVGTLTDLHSVTAATLTFTYTNTYTVTTAFNAHRAAFGTPLTYTSSHATLKVPFVIDINAVANVGLVNFTRVDASGGQTIRSFNGVITDCINIFPFTNVPTMSGGL